MSAKKGRGAKLLKKPPERKQTQEASPAQSIDPCDLPFVDKFGFLAGLGDKNSDAPLHSTAIEEDLNPSLERQVEEGGPGNKGVQRKATLQPRQAAVKRKEASGGVKRKKISAGEEGKIRSETVPAKESRAKVEAETKSRTPQVPQSPKTSGQPSAVRQLVGKKPTKKAAAQTPTPRSVKSQQTRGKKGKSKAKGQNPLKSQLQEQSDSDTAEQTYRRVFSSDEEDEMDANWSPSPKKKARTPRSTAHRKCSSAEENGASGKETKTKTKQSKRPAAQETQDADVILDNFLQFCDKYRESVKSMDTFSRNVPNQLLDQVTLLKEMKVLRRKNSKEDSLLRTKTRRILKERNQITMTKKTLDQLQKEEVQLKKQVSDMMQGLNFLTNIRELNSQYLSHRHKHPSQRETYGPSSLPALQLEAMYHKGSEQQRLEAKEKIKTTRPKGQDTVLH